MLMQVRGITDSATDRPANDADRQIEQERRGKPRISGSFPVTVRGIDTQGQPFECEASVDNMSSSGLHMKLAHSLDRQAKLFLVVRLQDAAGNLKGPTVATIANVTRVEPQLDGGIGIAVRFNRYRFL